MGIFSWLPEHATARGNMRRYLQVRTGTEASDYALEAVEPPCFMGHNPYSPLVVNRRHAPFTAPARPVVGFPERHDTSSAATGLRPGFSLVLLARRSSSQPFDGLRTCLQILVSLNSGMAKSADVHGPGFSVAAWPPAFRSSLCQYQPFASAWWMLMPRRTGGFDPGIPLLILLLNVQHTALP